jgi:uncharacterized protein (TIGR02271 family)
MLITGLGKMALYRIKDFDPDYQIHCDNHDLRGLDLYTGNDKIGSVDDVLVDDQGQLRYLVINTGVWILGKKVLFPIGRSRIDYERNRVYADNLTKAQVEALPEFTNDMTVDYHHEEQVRGVYRNSMRSVEQSVPVEQSVSVEQSGPLDYNYSATAGKLPISDSGSTLNPNVAHEGYDRDSYKYEKEPDLYTLTEQNHPNLKLYEERLVTGKTRQKAGEAVVSKRVETETARASVGIEKERIVVERVPVNGETAIAPGEANFQAGEVSRLDVYEEVPEFRKEAFVREEVRVNKVVDQETVTAEEQLRREELDVKDAKGRPISDSTK